MNTAYWLNSLWAGKCRREAGRFRAATRAVEDAQTNLLCNILARNRHSVFGTEHNFARLQTARNFQRHVPQSTFEDYHAALGLIEAGQPNVLTCQHVQLLEPTSGSTGGEKRIPYTADLRQQFQRAIDAWIHNLLTCRPKVRGGRAYWSISPCLGPAKVTAGGIPVGFDDDVAYLSRWERWAVRQLLVVPSQVARLANMQNFRYVTLLHLLSATDLALISVWSPTFLTALLKPLEEWLERICHDLRRGTISWPVTEAGSQNQKTGGRDARAGMGRAPKRAELLESTWTGASSLADFLSLIWPRLQLISCWSDASAGQYVPSLRALFPSIEIQPKGLLATEACVSLPVCDRSGAALAIRSHFFEFEECDANGNCSPARTKLAHEIERGGRYRVVVTTGGGLYRYQLGDLIEVVDFLQQCPLIRLVGRIDKVSDLAGEKLAEAHVREVFRSTFAGTQLSPELAMLVPRSQPEAGYHLLVQSRSQPLSHDELARIRDLVEAGLMENPYYRHAIDMQQLAPLRAKLLAPSAPSCWKLYEDACLARGQKVGDIKPTVLAPVDWLVNVAETNVAETNVAETNVAETNVAETNVAETNVAETNVAETNVAETAKGSEDPSQIIVRGN